MSSQLHLHSKPCANQCHHVVIYTLLLSLAEAKFCSNMLQKDHTERMKHMARWLQDQTAHDGAPASQKFLANDFTLRSVQCKAATCVLGHSHCDYDAPTVFVSVYRSNGSEPAAQIHQLSAAGPACCDGVSDELGEQHSPCICLLLAAHDMCDVGWGTPVQ